MHTDEYEISLSRELDVCRSVIRKIERSLRRIEEALNLTPEALVQRYHDGEMRGGDENIAAWIEQYEALRRWEERRGEFVRLYRHFKGERGTP